jgi:hypothetical protein
MIALLVAGDPMWPRERFRQVAVLTLFGGFLYTGFSEWLNVEVRKACAYSNLMPVLQVAGFGLGLSPMLQWLVVPALAFRAASSAVGSRPDARETTGGTLDVAQLPSRRSW